MTHYRKLVGKKCYLSPCSLEDAEKWATWDNDLETTVPLGDEAYTPIALAKTKENLSRTIQHQDHVFSIVDSHADTLIGRCLLFNMDQVNGNGTVGIVIGEKEYWGRGYGQEAIKLLLDYGFNLLNLNNIMIGTFEYNKRAIQCYEKVGFREIGQRRQARTIGGKKYDVILMDILADEFESIYVNQFIEQEAEPTGKVQ